MSTHMLPLTKMGDLPDGDGRCSPSTLRLNPDDAGSLAAASRALGHPVRLQILDLLGLRATCASTRPSSPAR
jgi:hypothetical protein